MSVICSPKQESLQLFLKDGQGACRCDRGRQTVPACTLQHGASIAQFNVIVLTMGRGAVVPARLQGTSMVVTVNTINTKHK